MDQNHSSSSKTDKKNIVKELESLLPHQYSSKEIISLSDQLEGAAKYIKKLQMRLEAMKQKKKKLLMMGNSGNLSLSFTRDSRADGGLNVSQIDLHLNGSALDVVLKTGLNHQFMFAQTVRILHEEGADIIRASFSVVDHTVFHSIHAKIGGCGFQHEAAEVYERLRRMVEDN